MYRAFADEQDDRLLKKGGPGQVIGMADLFLNQVFSNPMLRGT